MRTLLLVCLVVQSFAQSPPRDRAEQKQRTDNKQAGASSAPGSAATPPASKPRGIDQPSPGDKRQPTDEKTDKVWEKAFAPETWSSWGLLVAAVVASWLAFRTLGVIRRQTEEAIRAGRLAETALYLTERADILLDAAGGCEQDLTAGTVIRLRFKNFGRTRANRAEVNARLLLPGVEMQPGKDFGAISSVAVGAGKTLTASFHPLGDALTEDTVRLIRYGEQLLRFEAQVAYFDVFDKPHHTKCSGTLLPEPCVFRIDENQESD